MMKNFIRLIALIGVIAMVVCTAACGSTQTNTQNDPVPTGPPPEPNPAKISGAPTEGADSSTQADEKTADPDTALKDQLTADRWNLTAVYKDGEEQNISVQYGSVIRETGAYMEFSGDDTFKCILGYPGCAGTYSVDNGAITLHITTEYDGKSDSGNACDETADVKWDQDANTLSFDFYGVTNVFAQ